MKRYAVLFGVFCRMAMAGFGIVVFLAVTGGAPAHAMSPGHCENYAHKAVQEFYLANKTPACGEQSGPRWHNDFVVHYNWCLASTDESIRSEANARRELLSACAYGHVNPPVNHSYNPAWQAAPGDTRCCPNNMLVCPLGRHFCG